MDTLSQSAVNQLLKCGEAFRRRYLEREYTPPSLAALAGTAVHAAAESYFRRKRDAGEELSVEDVQQAAVDAFDRRMAKDGAVLDEEEQARGKDVVVGEAKDKAVRLSGLYRRELAPSVQPDLIEARIEVEVPGLKRRIVGVVDLSSQPEVACEGGDLIDLKTSKRRGSQEDADRSIQLTVYDVAYEALKGWRPRRIVLHELVDTKVPQANVTETTRGPEDRAALGAILGAAERTIDAGTFLPAAPGSWWCSLRFCAYAPTCPYFARRGAK